MNIKKVIPEKICAANENMRILIDRSSQGINRLFALAYLNDNTSTAKSYRKYFLPRIKIENYDIEIDGRNYDQPINDSTGQSNDYTTGCLLDFSYFEKNHRLIAVDLRKQKVLDADSRAIQHIIFTGKTSQVSVIYYIYEK